MGPIKNTQTISLMLTFVAGFCDTVTFVAADGVFSAHVTGNFILLAHDVVNHTDGESWLKLLTFPVFIVAVMISGWMAKKFANKHFLLLSEGILLCLCSMLSLLVNSSTMPLTNIVTMMIVFAMGVQNGFGKIYNRETYGPTTVMTGNVTGASLDFTDAFRDASKRQSLQKQGVMIGGFLLGCLSGAFAAKQLGLGGVVLPGIALIVLFSKDTSQAVFKNS
jgi:uncharacterized membrane protein YoaK (UPF0700 family)